MKLIYNIMALMLMSVFTNSLMAQSQDYTISSDYLYIDDENVSIASTIEKQGNLLIWTQQVNGKSLTTTYTITSTNDNWDYNANSGTISHNVVLDNLQSTFTLSSTSNGFTAELVSYTSSNLTERFNFHITSLTHQ